MKQNIAKGKNFVVNFWIGKKSWNEIQVLINIICMKYYKLYNNQCILAIDLVQIERRQTPPNYRIICESFTNTELKLFNVESFTVVYSSKTEGHSAHP